jgi:dTMP kinase
VTAPGPLFLSVDGIDGAGKSTQIARLVSHLASQGREVIAVRDPGSTEVGTRLRQILLDSDLKMHRRTEAMLFMASRCELIESTIRPALSHEKTVVSDRFLLANVVYQSIGSQGVSAELLWEMGLLAAGGLRPDVTILLDLPAEIAVRRLRGEHDRMESRGIDYLEAVRVAFREQLPRSSPQTILVDANQPIERISAHMIEAIDAITNASGGSESVGT